MTQESPERVPTDPLFCDDCGKDLVVERDGDALQLVCGCGDTVEIFWTEEPLPEAWAL